MLGDPMDEALALTRQADEVPQDPHGAVTAAELRLRREAHMALCQTAEFRAHRRRILQRHPDADCRDEWRRPSGDLVRKLAAQRAPLTRVFMVPPGTFERERR